MSSYRMSTRKKLAIATWTTPKEANIYGKLTLDLTKTLQYIDYLRRVKDTKISITHVVAAAVGRALKMAPDINGRILFGRYVPYESVDLSILVSLEEGKDLAKVKICNADQKSSIQIADELRACATKLRAGKDEEFKKSKPLLRWLPTWLIRPVLWAIGFVTAALGLDFKALGLEKFPFGACVVTSVGMYGIDEGYAPQIPFARVPVYIAITRIKERVAVENGQLLVRPELDLMATIDHRFMDGHEGANLAKVVRNLIENPWKLDGHKEMPMQDALEAPSVSVDEATA